MKVTFDDLWVKEHFFQNVSTYNVTILRKFGLGILTKRMIKRKLINKKQESNHSKEHLSIGV